MERLFRPMSLIWTNLRLDGRQPIINESSFDRGRPQLEPEAGCKIRERWLGLRTVWLLFDSSPFEMRRSASEYLGRE